MKIKISKYGPYLVTGKLPLAKEIAVGNVNNGPESWSREEEIAVPESYSLCRCGQSGNKPFCDGQHEKINFKGTETANQASFAKYIRRTEGPDIDLLDNPTLCSGSRFCHLGHGTWQDTRDSDDDTARENAIQSACNCPSGRLVAIDKSTGQEIEPLHAPSIGVIEDPQIGVSGPLWVKGGVEIESAAGEIYQKRNRVTLCRCGRSSNMPFCDASHISHNFKDGDVRLG